MKLGKFLVYIMFSVFSLVSYSKTTIVTSFSIISDMVENVAGDKVKVISLVAHDKSPHDFEPRPQDSKLLSNADLVIINGLGLEGSLERFIHASGYKGEIIVASTGVTAEEGSAHEHSHHHDHKHHDHNDDHHDHKDDHHDHKYHGHKNDHHDHKHQDDEHHDHDHGAIDPHAWNSLQNGVIYVKNIKQALIKLDPENANYYTKNANAYIKEIKALDKYAKQEFAKIPVAKRKVLSGHDAFGYFSKAYGIKFLAPLGLTAEETSAQNIAKLIDQIKAEKVKYYFVESQMSHKLVEQIAKATGAKKGGELYPESLGDKSGPASSYLTAAKHNIDTILNSFKQ